MTVNSVNYHIYTAVQPNKPVKENKDGSLTVSAPREIKISTPSQFKERIRNIEIGTALVLGAFLGLKSVKKDFGQGKKVLEFLGSLVKGKLGSKPVFQAISETLTFVGGFALATFALDKVLNRNKKYEKAYNQLKSIAEK